MFVHIPLRLISVYYKCIWICCWSGADMKRRQCIHKRYTQQNTALLVSIYYNVVTAHIQNLLFDKPFYIFKLIFRSYTCSWKKYFTKYFFLLSNFYFYICTHVNALISCSVFASPMCFVPITACEVTMYSKKYVLNY